MVDGFNRFSRPSVFGTAWHKVQRRRLVLGAMLTLLAALLAACNETTGPPPEPALRQPTPTAALAVSPTATRPTVAPAPTPTLHREWEILAVTADGSTVTVDLRLYAGVDVWVVLDDADPDEISWSNDGVLRHLFRAVNPGTREIAISDVMGFNETLKVRVPSAPPEPTATVRPRE